LGLSICYSIMKQLGGHIAVHSEVGKGSEFTLFIPGDPPRQLREDMANANEGQLAAMSF
jgi:two-component system NtrC family sensor kinase